MCSSSSSKRFTVALATCGIYTCLLAGAVGCSGSLGEEGEAVGPGGMLPDVEVAAPDGAPLDQGGPLPDSPGMTAEPGSNGLSAYKPGTLGASRLTEEQYANAVGDIFGAAAPLPGALIPLTPLHGSTLLGVR